MEDEDIIYVPDTRTEEEKQRSKERHMELEIVWMHCEDQGFTFPCDHFQRSGRACPYMDGDLVFRDDQGHLMRASISQLDKRSR
jgi:hypothetical protein